MNWRVVMYPDGSPPISVNLPADTPPEALRKAIDLQTGHGLVPLLTVSAFFVERQLD